MYFTNTFCCSECTYSNGNVSRQPTIAKLKITEIISYFYLECRLKPDFDNLISQYQYLPHI